MKVKSITSSDVSVQTDNGTIYISEEKGSTNICYYDHLNIKITGKHKHKPHVLIELDEYATVLEIEKTDTPWSDCSG